MSDLPSLRRMPDGFLERGEQVTRLEAFVDAAFAFAVTQAKPNSRLTVQAMAALSEHGVVAPSIVHDRVDYAASMIDGRTVSETAPKGRSAAEIGELLDCVQARLHDKKKTKKKETT